ncbi:MAG: polysaccharide biosynthesis C-terminal domain-containing protein [Candidatus Latescibacterota bacterium]|nr:polysaccharide biosynthesis C-terminal domain-containing protein [Candidatus Latescibacterota bacterium]
MSFLRDFSFNTTSAALVFAVGLLNQGLLAGHLGKSDYGIFTLWTQTSLIAALVFGEWLRRGTTYVVGKEKKIGEAKDNVIIYVGILIPTALLICWLLRPRLVSVLGSPINDYWYLIALMASAVILQRCGQAVLLGLDRIRAYAVVPLVFICSYGLLNIFLWYNNNLNIFSGISVFIGAALIAAFVAFAFLQDTSRGVRVGDRKLLSAVYSVGRRGAISVLLVFLLLKSDLYLVNYYLGTESVGIYRVAVNFADMMQRVPDLAGAVLLAKVIRNEDNQNLSWRVTCGIGLFSLVCALGFVVIGDQLISIFFPGYEQAYEPLIWMLPGLIFLGVGSVLNTKLAGLGYPAVTQWAPAIALAMNIGLNMYFLPKFGLRGAALATSISYAFWATCIAWAFFRSDSKHTRVSV